MVEKLTKGIIVEWCVETIGWWAIERLDNDLGIGTPEGKNTRRVTLHRLVSEKVLEKHPHKEGWYRYIRTDARKLDPNADPKGVINLNWPKADDGTSFGLSDVKIYPRSVIIVAGVSNQGKTTLCLNFLVENMDNHHCVYMTNELSDEEFVDRISPFDNVKGENGNWKFDAFEHFENFQDILNPDAINIIDYLDPGENPYYVGVIIDQIRQRLNKGIAFIAIQKRVGVWYDKKGDKHFSYSEYGTGGQYSEHRARLVLHIDPTEDGKYQLYIKKSKNYQLTGRKFKFDIVKRGSRFHHITELGEDENIIR